MTVREYIESDIKKENLKLTWMDVKKAWQKENPNSKMGSAKQNLALYNAWKEKKWRPKTSPTPTPASNGSSGTSGTSGVVGSSGDDKHAKEKEILEKSGVIDCLKKLKKFTVNSTIKQNGRGSWYYELTNPSFPKHVYQFYSNGKMVKRKIETDAIEKIIDMDEEGWDCPQWKNYNAGTSGVLGSSGSSGVSGSSGGSGSLGTSGYSGSSGVSGSSGGSGSSGTSGSSGLVPTKLFTKDEIKALSKREREALNQQIIPERMCVKQIKRFHDAYIKDLYLDTDGGEKDHNTTKDIVKRCRTQHKYNDKIQGYLDDLISINYNWEPSKRRFRIMDSIQSDSIIKESLKKKIKLISETKENNLIKENILKKRLSVHENQINNFTDFTTRKKIKIGFKFLREIHRLKRINLINEELSGVFKELFGDSLEKIVDNVSQPLFKSLLTKLQIPEEFKNQILSEILSDRENLISHMENCDSLSEFVSEKIGIIIGDKIRMETMIGNQFIDDTITDLLDDDNFTSVLNDKIKEEVCRIFDIYVENAKNLVTKIQQDLELPE